MNNLHDSTIEKILREQFKGDTPILEYRQERKAFISMLRQKLSTMTDVKLLQLSPNYRYSETDSEEICYFKILSSSKYYRDTTFYLLFNDQNELIIEAGYRHSSPIYHLEQIYTLTDKMKLEYNRVEKNYLKREREGLKKRKIQALKHKAVIGKIHQIAKEDKFYFHIKEYATKITLVIRLADNKHLDIDIPHNKIQETAQQLHATIQTLMALHDSGISFKINRMGYHKPYWIHYD